MGVSSGRRWTDSKTIADPRKEASRDAIRRCCRAQRNPLGAGVRGWGSLLSEVVMIGRSQDGAAANCGLKVKFWRCAAAELTGACSEYRGLLQLRSVFHSPAPLGLALSSLSLAVACGLIIGCPFSIVLQLTSFIVAKVLYHSPVNCRELSTNDRTCTQAALLLPDTINVIDLASYFSHATAGSIFTTCSASPNGVSSTCCNRPFDARQLHGSPIIHE